MGLGWLVVVAGCAAHVSRVADVDPPQECAPDVASAVDAEPAGPSGAELFARTWVAMDPRAGEGDGLGPVFNGRSCAGCHAQGGLGGSGGSHANVVVPGRMVAIKARASTELSFAVRATPALFGAARIDAVPEGELLVAEALGVDGHPEITGRAARDRGGRIGRFGWKGQVASLAAFVELACANELGLETAAAHQPGDAAPGIDLDDDALDALVGFVEALPQPIELQTPGIDEGRALFAEVGCDGCHRERLGDVEGLYSDLLLHDLGPELSDAGGGYGVALQAAADPGAAQPGEWRTPPLWGLRDSAPYLHDGMAPTVERAIDLHAGEASAVVRAWRRLSDADRAAIGVFLGSLAAPAAGGGGVALASAR